MTKGQKIKIKETWDERSKARDGMERKKIMEGNGKSKKLKRVLCFDFLCFFHVLNIIRLLI